MASTNYPAAGVNGNTYTSSTTGPYETTGANNVPYTAPNTGTTGTTGTTGLAGTSGTAAPATTTGGVVKEPGHGGIGGVFAKVHGAGEAVRGAFNSKVDDTFNGVCAIPPPFATGGVHVAFWLEPIRGESEKFTSRIQNS